MGVTIQWTGLLDWNTGLDYWTDIFLVPALRQKSGSETSLLAPQACSKDITRRIPSTG